MSRNEAPAIGDGLGRGQQGPAMGRQPFSGEAQAAMPSGWGEPNLHHETH